MPGTSAQNYSRRNPDDLRFTKGTINLDCPGHFQCDNIYDVLYALENGKLIPRDLPSLRVISHGSQLWTLENKLLYIYRISPKVKRVSVVHVSNGQKFLEKFLAEYSSRDVERMSSSEFFPEVENCDKSPTKDLCLYRADCALPSPVKNLFETKKLRGKRSPAGKLSARSVSSSKAVTSRISSENSETFTPSASLGSKCVHSENKTSTAIVALSVGSKSAHRDSKTSRSRRASSTGSSGFSSPSEDSMDTKTPCYPAVRTMTGHLPLSVDSLRISSPVEEHENARARRRRFSFPSFAERPSTCHAYSKFSCSRSSSATRPPMLEKPSSEPFSGSAPAGLAAFSDSREHIFHSRFSPTLLDNSRKNTSRCVSENCEEDSEQDVSQECSAKFPNASRETVSHSFSSTIDMDDEEDDEPDDDFELEAFVLPKFCYLPPKACEINDDDNDEMSSSSSQKPSGFSSQASSSRDRLDRYVSSCSSSTERPTKKKAFGGEPRRSESEGVSSCSSSMEPPTKKPFGGSGPRRSGSEGGPHKTSRTAAIGRSVSPLRRASVSAERPMKCHLSAEHEFEVSKQILLKHMKPYFLCAK